MALKPVEESVLSEWLTQYPHWQGTVDGIQATFTWSNFPQVIAFMQHCVEGIEERQHHPEWHNVYNRLSISLRTHDAGDKVTDKDLDLAQWLQEQALAAGGLSAGGTP